MTFELNFSKAGIWEAIVNLCIRKKDDFNTYFYLILFLIGLCKAEVHTEGTVTQEK